MSDPKRNKVIYVSVDSKLWMKMNLPFGMIPPPQIEIYKPLEAPVTFYLAESYRLEIPEEAQKHGRLKRLD